MNAPTDLHAGAPVYSSDGHKLGELHRVVLRRGDLTATHIVVDIGFLRAGHPVWEGGLGLDYDRIVPVADVAGSTDDRVDLRITALQFKDAPEYTIESFEPLPDYTGPDEDLGDKVQDVFIRLGNPGTYLVERLNKPLDSVDIAEGTPVWRREPHEKLGEVDRVLLDGGGSVRAFVIRRGFLLKHDVVLPVRYVVELLDDLVRVDISDDQLDALSEFEG